MNIFKLVFDYIDKYPEDEPIFIEDIKEYNLDFEKIIKYARETNNKKVLDKLFVLAR